MKLPPTCLIPAVLPALLVLALAGCTTVEQVRPEETENPEADRLQGIVSQLQQDHDMPGLSVAIATDDGELLTASAGVANLESGTPVTPDTMFFLGSVAKNFFATIALRLADQGRLDLESPLADFVEWPRGEEITVRMLLNHTSGIPDYLSGEIFAAAGDGGIPDFFRTRRTPTELMATIPDRSPIFDPGRRQEYSNTNGLLVGEVIRTITSKPLAMVFEDQIVQPLGLSHTYLYGESTNRRDRARGYSGAGNWGASAGELADCSTADEALPDSADGSVVASAGDLLRYHQALRQGDLISANSWAAMSTVQPGFHNGLGYLLTNGPFGRVEGNLGRSMGHTAANLYYVDLDTYVVILSNRSDVPLPLEPLLRQWFGMRVNKNGRDTKPTEGRYP